MLGVSEGLMRRVPTERLERKVADRTWFLSAKLLSVRRLLSCEIDFFRVNHRFADFTKFSRAL